MDWLICWLINWLIESLIDWLSEWVYVLNVFIDIQTSECVINAMDAM